MVVHCMNMLGGKLTGLTDCPRQAGNIGQGVEVLTEPDAVLSSVPHSQ